MTTKRDATTETASMKHSSLYDVKVSGLKRKDGGDGLIRNPLRAARQRITKEANFSFLCSFCSLSKIY